MKRIAVLSICLVLIMVCFTSCTNNSEEFTKKSYTADTEQIAELHIDVRDRQIEVSLSADNKIHINYFESSKEYYEISVSQDNVLVMSAASSKDWKDYIGGKSSLDSRKISVQLPDTILKRLDVSTTNEDILILELPVIGDISLLSNGGNLLFDKLNVENGISLKTKNGDISGSIVGGDDDYTVFCDIKKGKSNVQSSKGSGTKRLDVSNNNGDIDIEFVKE